MVRTAKSGRLGRKRFVNPFEPAGFPLSWNFIEVSDFFPCVRLFSVKRLAQKCRAPGAAVDMAATFARLFSENRGRDRPFYIKDEDFLPESLHSGEILRIFAAELSEGLF